MNGMRALVPYHDGDVDVHEWYARDWIDRGGLRANFVSSVDGGATAAGLSRGLQTPGDNRIFAALREREFTRMLCEGGPTLFGELAQARVADELCLSISPMLTGPGARRIVAGELWPGEPAPLELVSLLEEDGALFARYRLS